MRAVHFCQACGKVQPPAPVDYFTFFGLPRKLSLDVSALDKDFYELSRKLHPDLNARAGSQEQEWSLQQSSLLNDAHRTLKDPIKRTAVSFEARRRGTGRAIENRDRAGPLHRRIKKQIVPPDLLEEVFDLNMQLEELRMQKKMGEDDPALIEEIGRPEARTRRKAGSASARASRSLEDVGWNDPAGTQRSARLRRRTQAGTRQNGGRAEPQKLHPQPGSGCE